ncbi:amidohydrolase [Actinoplanes sp. SE50]|uniref:amidohydrolase family protein n=1 Tax=unclassified Actinoplanes TaxID=2626549 RepID=UPI00023EBC35|nr:MULTISPECIES: amidohydrolase/deacetylase family metallohydrolase [unclassified Actinoplanes]AEV87392.1 dihydroorotase [Actinoplanes sp. SE50/110]ATO85794.1 amidohydrolase [Actinoplanes sp. SE50]SLM03207.1 amidohydrolase [Actinoplanes sp. SE50/110]
MTFDILLTGGTLLPAGPGPAGVRRNIGDVAIRDGRIAAIGPALPRDAHRVVDVSGRLVTPGLIDLHTHVGPGYWGIDPDPVAWHSGVTTWVDAGSAGAYTLDGLRRVAAAATVRVPALLNISAIGLAGRTGESRDLATCDVPLAIDTIQTHRELIRGVKVRIDRDTVGDNGIEPLRRGLTAAEACGVPVMVHIGTAPPRLDEVLDLLRPGDIVTHCASGIAAPLGPAVHAAAGRGVLLDLGHGSGGFAFDVLQAQLDAGLMPHTVSTDLHARSLYGPVFDLPTTMAKLLAVGVPLPEVIAAATVHPARALGLPGGTLAIGAPADLAIFRVRDEEFPVVDAHREVRISPVRLVNEATYVGGALLPPRLPAPPAPWIPLTEAQRAALDQRARHIRDLLATPLVGVDGLAEQFPRDQPRSS